MQNITTNWFSLTKDEIDMLITHIENYDFPETENTIINQAKNAGFSKCELIYRDQKHPRYLLVCYK
ncbi:hypothetical protein ACP6PK_11590 [Dapis sp. BLCC M172]